MTRKEELEARADLLSRQLGSGHGGKPIILKALQQVEREVWEKAIKEMEESGNGKLSGWIQWLKKQQKELG